MYRQQSRTPWSPALTSVLVAVACLFAESSVARAQAQGRVVTIRCKASGLVLTARGTSVIQAPFQAGNRAQEWLLLESPGNVLQMVNQGTNTALTVDRGDEKTPVRLSPLCPGQFTQYWRMEGTGTQYVILLPSLHHKRALDIPRGSPQQGVALQIYRRHGGDNQLWLLDRVR